MGVVSGFFVVSIPGRSVNEFLTESYARRTPRVTNKHARPPKEVFRLSFGVRITYCMSSTPFTVLVAEDDERDLSLLRAAFAELGFHEDFRVVANPDHAIEYLSGEGAFANRSACPRPSLILISLKISRKSDFKILRWMRKQGFDKRIPVVILADSRQPPGFEQAYDLGAVWYLVKPIDLHALQSTLKAVEEFWRLNVR